MNYAMSEAWQLLRGLGRRLKVEGRRLLGKRLP